VTPLTGVDRVVDNLPTNFGLLRTFQLIGQHLSDASRDLATLTLKVTALVADAGLRSPSVHHVTMCEVRRPSRSEDIRHLLCVH